MRLFRKVFDFIVHPTNSRTTAILVLLILSAAVPLTVYVAQQQQSIRQRAACENSASPICSQECTERIINGENIDLNSCIDTCVRAACPASAPTPSLNEFDQCVADCRNGPGAFSGCEDVCIALRSTPTPIPTFTPIPAVSLIPTTALQLRPHVYILEDDGTFDIYTPWAITKKFYEKYPDNYDFIGIHYKHWNPENTGADSGWVKQTVKGNFGPPGVIDQSSLYGSTRLLSIYLNRFDFDKSFVEYGPNNEAIRIIDDVYFLVIIHEIMHHWGVFLPDELREAQKYIRESGTYDKAHWAPHTGSWLSRSQSTREKYIEKDGKFYYREDCSKEPKNHDFDLYSMGLKPADEITEKLVVVHYKHSYGPLPGRCDTSIEVPPGYTTRAFTLQDFIDVLGPRIPSVVDAQKDFTIAFVMVVPKGETPSQKQIDALNWIADKFPITWYKSTEGRSTMNGIKPTDTTPPIISNVKTSATSSSIEVTWNTNEPSSAFVTYYPLSTNVPLQILIYPNIITNPPKFSTSHKIKIEASDWSPLTPNAEYSIKIISIDEDYNMTSFDAGKIVTRDISGGVAPTPIPTADSLIALDNKSICISQCGANTSSPNYVQCVNNCIVGISPIPTIPPLVTIEPTIIISPTTAPTTPATSSLPYCYLKNKGDADCDNKITLLDFNIWKDEFIKVLNNISIQKTSDFNSDGAITIVDFNIWKTGFADLSLPH